MTLINIQQLSSILHTVCPKLSTTHNLEYKNSFGAVAGYIDGNIFIVYGKFGLALKLPPKTIEELYKDKEATPFKYFKNGHTKKEYAIITKKIMGNKDRLKKLVNKSIRYVL